MSTIHAMAEDTATIFGPSTSRSEEIQRAWVSELNDAEARVRSTQHRTSRTEFDKKVITFIRHMGYRYADEEYLKLIRIVRAAFHDLAQYRASLDVLFNEQVKEVTGKFQNIKKENDDDDESVEKSREGCVDGSSGANDDKSVNKHGKRSAFESEDEYGSEANYESSDEYQTQSEDEDEEDIHNNCRSKKRCRGPQEDKKSESCVLAKKPRYASTSSQPASEDEQSIPGHCGKKYLLSSVSEKFALGSRYTYSRKSLPASRISCINKTLVNPHEPYARKTIPGFRSPYSNETLLNSSSFHIEKVIPAPRSSHANKLIRGSYPAYSDKTLPSLHSSKSASPSNSRSLSTKKRAWTDEEYYAISRAVRNRRQLETYTGEKKLRDVALWSIISDELEAAGYERTPSSCKNYWSREGRQRSGFEERINPPSDGSLVSSAQVSKKKRAVTEEF